MANYDFVVNSHFNPFSLQEMLTPFAAYKEEFDKTEEAYDKLADANNFEYLSKTLPEGSKAREIYEGYANDLNAQAQDFAQNGLTMGNRGALTTLKRRYKGEIGRLIKADEAMKEEKKLRQTLNAQDSSRLYAEDNLSIDNFLDGSNPNLYSISGKEIYARGAAAGKAASSRVFNFGEGEMTLGGYYRDLVSKNGLSPEVLNKFMQDMNSIPELKASFDNYMVSSGIEGNLKGVNKERAAKEYLSGVLDGAMYQVNHSPQRDLGKIDAATQAQMDLTKETRDIELKKQGYSYDSKTGDLNYNVENDKDLERTLKIYDKKLEALGKGKNGSGGSSSKETKIKEKVMIGANSGKRYKSEKTSVKKPGVGENLNNTESARILTPEEIAKLYKTETDDKGNQVTYIANQYLRSIAGGEDLSGLVISVMEGAGNDGEDVYIVEPRGGGSSGSSDSSSSYEDDIPN